MAEEDSGLRQSPAWQQSWSQAVLLTPALWKAELSPKVTCSQKPLPGSYSSILTALALLLPGSGWVWQGCSLPNKPWVQGEQLQQTRRLWMCIQTKPKHLEILHSLTPNTFDMLKQVLYSVRNQIAVLLFQIIRSILLDDEQKYCSPKAIKLSFTCLRA